MSFIDDVKFDESGLIPAIAQDYVTGEVLMLAYMNKESLLKTLETKRAHYYSRSRKSLWQKGETSGHFQNVMDVRYDCDGDAVLLIIEQIGKTACHTGERTCFYRSAIDGLNIDKQDFSVLFDIQNTIISRKNTPKEGSYTNYLLEKGADKILKKIGEEAAEVIIATKNQDKDEIVYETSDLMYHLSVNLVHSGLSWEEVFRELRKR